MLRNKGGQTVIELVVVLPVFMMIIFVVLELGNIAYHTLIAHHISYELARVGSMVGVKKHSGKTDYTSSPMMTMYRALRVEEIKLPAGTYYLQFKINDMFMRSMELDMVEFTWDGEKIVFRTDLWEGTVTLNPLNYYSE